MSDSLTPGQHTDPQKIRNSPRFRQLQRSRARLSWTLSAIVLLAGGLFMWLVSAHPDWLRQPIWEGSSLSRAIPLGALLLIGSWLLMGLYMLRANQRLDRLNRELLEELQA